MVELPDAAVVPTAADQPILMNSFAGQRRVLTMIVRFSDGDPIATRQTVVPLSRTTVISGLMRAAAVFAICSLRSRIFCLRC